MSITPTPSAAALPDGAPKNATLSDTSNNTVYFDFNPQKITITHASQRQTVPSSNQGSTGDTSTTGGDGGGGALNHQDQVTNVGATTIALADVIFNGVKTVDNCKQLLAWSYPGTKGSVTAAGLTKLIFKWGSSINYSVTMLSVDVTYERFTPSGQPLRATARIKLQYEGTTPPGTNPTSGGIPGRRSHILVSGENLQHLATANYGKPGAWRALAAVNGIEDPLAVQPGTVIYLPAQAELADGRPR
jgi:nucleoid-associated protein YgaU